MAKAKSGKAPTPNKLAKLGKKTGVELTESQLDKATGGLLGVVDGESMDSKHKGEVG